MEERGLIRVSSTGVARSWTWTRCWLAGDPVAREAILVDPATLDDSERSAVGGRLTEGWKIVAIVLTHGHPDHTVDAGYWRDELGAPLAGHADDLPLFTDPSINGSGLFGREVAPGAPDILLADGDELRAGSVVFRVIHLPGHSPGSIGLHAPGHVISGDTLFAGSIGVDSIPGLGRLWGASLEQEVRSIREKLYVLPRETEVHPGHGPDTTIGTEMDGNPFAPAIRSTGLSQ